MEEFRKFIEKYTPVPENEWKIISQAFRLRKYVRNEIILQEGEVCRYFYFYERGLIRFFSNVNGEDVTITFAEAPYCFTSNISFRAQKPANESIQALEETVLWRVTFEQYENLEEIRSWNIFIKKLYNEIQELMERWLLESKVYTAEKNYQLLYERFPAEFIQRIPLKHLASFLGVAPQSLSRIRNNLHQNSRS